MTRALSQHLAGWLFGLTLACAAPPALAVSIFACEPEWGWTFACRASGSDGEKSVFARAIASDSAWSTNSQPP